MLEHSNKILIVKYDLNTDFLSYLFMTCISNHSLSKHHSILKLLFGIDKITSGLSDKWRGIVSLRVCQSLKAGHNTELLTQCWLSCLIYPEYLKNFKAHLHCDLDFLKKKFVINLWQSSDTFWDLLGKILGRPQGTGDHTWTERSQGSFIRYQHKINKVTNKSNSIDYHHFHKMCPVWDNL